jgi:hypothetical protein
VVRRAGLAALVAALFVLAVPASAWAVGFEVNGTGDGANQAECETGSTADECTLRGAIEAANVGPDFSVVEFPSSVFHGQAETDKIELGSALAITQPVMLLGHPVPGSVVSPNVEVVAHAGEAAFAVESSGVSIEEIAFGGGSYGIEAPGLAAGLNVRSDWFGLKLDATANAIAAAGILLGPGADETTIGGGVESERNVFANATVGVQIEGASKVKVLGNYLGVGPTGLGTPPFGTATLEEGVRIVDTMASAAEENEIGGILGGAELATTQCDGPCNVIATQDGQGVNLAGSFAEPAPAATGPTVIRGNYIGLGADGTTLAGGRSYGVLAAPSSGTCAAGPSDVTVGGTVAGARNYFAGGTVGIAAESAENFSAIGNAIGVTPAGSAITSPEASAITLCAESVTEPALIGGNEMVLEPDTIGIESFFGQALILGNSIQGGLFGIQTREAGAGGGDIIQANSISGTDRQGMLIADDFNVVTGNSIIDAAWAGITIEEGAEHNRIGGDAIGEANTISASGLGNPAGAIQIEGEESSRNEVAANTGSGNVGAFIELDGPGSQIPNGLKPPAVATAFQSSAAGTAAPNATVRVFSKASAAPGELGALLAVVKADGLGAWTATYPTQPVGTLVAATQTSAAGTAAAGTSEVSAPTASVVDPPKPPEPDRGGGGGGSTQLPAAAPLPSPSMPVAPKAKITSSPKKNGTATTAKFKFKAEPSAGAKFECKLDGAKWAKCSPPKTYRNLKPGKHTFRVKATASGLTGAVAKYQFTIKS